MHWELAYAYNVESARHHCFTLHLCPQLQFTWDTHQNTSLSMKDKLWNAGRRPSMHLLSNWHCMSVLVRQLIKIKISGANICDLTRITVRTASGLDITLVKTLFVKVFHLDQVPTILALSQTWYHQHLSIMQPSLYLHHPCSWKPPRVPMLWMNQTSPDGRRNLHTHMSSPIQHQKKKGSLAILWMSCLVGMSDCQMKWRLNKGDASSTVTMK